MPSLGIAPRPGGCAGRERMPAQDVAPVSDVFPADGYLHLLEIGVQAIKLSPYRTNRAAHRSGRLDTTAAFLACSCPSWAFRNEVSHSIQERPSKSFPAASGIRQSASRRNFAISRGSPGASLPTPGHDRRFPGMLFSPFHLSDPGSAIRSRDLSIVPAHYAGDTTLRLVAQLQQPSATPHARPGRSPTTTPPADDERHEHRPTARPAGWAASSRKSPRNRSYGP